MLSNLKKCCIVWVAHERVVARLEDPMKFLLRLLCIPAFALSLAACGGGGGGNNATPPGQQIAVLDVDIAAGTVTVTSPASHLVVTGTSTDDGGGNATVNLSVLSNFPRLLFNLKALVTSLSDGTTAGDGDFAGDPYVYFGPNALAPAATESSSLTITGLGGTTFSMTVEWVDHPMVFVPGDNNGGGPILAMDSSGTGENNPIDTDAFALHAGGNAGNQGGAVSPDGRFLYLAPRNQPGIITVDLTTMTPVMGADLTGGTIAFDATGSVGFLDDVIMSPDGQFLYALLTEGCHSGGSFGGDVDGHGGASLVAPSDVHIVKLNRVTQAEVGRATLATALPLVDGNSPTGKGLSLSPSGTRLAACIREGGMVYVVDAATMTIFDADLVTAGTQGFDTTSIGNRPRRTVFRDDNSVLVALSGDGDSSGGTHDSTMLTIDVAARTVGSLAPAAEYAGTYTYNYIGAVRRHPDGRMFIFHPYNDNFPCVAAYDFGANMWTTAFDNPDSFDTAGACFSPDGSRVYIYVRRGLTDVEDSLVILDADTLLIEPMEATGDDEVLTQGTNTPYGHTCIVTPF